MVPRNSVVWEKKEPAHQYDHLHEKKHQAKFCSNIGNEQVSN